MDIKTQVIQRQTQILDNLARCEERISKLYALYARAFPEQVEFWENLSEIEKRHASSLRELHDQQKTGVIFCNIGRFDSEKIESFLEEIGDAITLIKKKSISPLEGIQTALSIESSVLDAHFYDIVRSDSNEYKSVAEQLSKDTHDHVKMVRDKFIEMQLENWTDTTNERIDPKTPIQIDKKYYE